MMPPLRSFDDVDGRERGQNKTDELRAMTTLGPRTLLHSTVPYGSGISEKESIIGVQWFQKNPDPRQASFPTGTVGPRVGIFLSPLNTNDGFNLSHMGKNNRNPECVRNCVLCLFSAVPWVGL